MPVNTSKGDVPPVVLNRGIVGTMDAWEMAVFDGVDALEGRSNGSHSEVPDEVEDGVDPAPSSPCPVYGSSPSASEPVKPNRANISRALAVADPPMLGASLFPLYSAEDVPDPPPAKAASSSSINPNPTSFLVDVDDEDKFELRKSVGEGKDEFEDGGAVKGVDGRRDNEVRLERRVPVELFLC